MPSCIRKHTYLSSLIIVFQYGILTFSQILHYPFSLVSTSFQHLGASKILYLDNDIWVVDSLDVIVKYLSTRSVVLTPHIIEPSPEDGKKQNDREILMAGAFNFGFVAFSNTTASGKFLDWWGKRLRHYGFVEPSRNLIFDQNWGTFIPAFFDHDDYYVIRDPRYNVAYWNFHYTGARLIMQDGVPHMFDETDMPDGSKSLETSSKPVVFLHFSGMSLLEKFNMETISRHQNRYTLTDLPQLRDVLDAYMALLSERNALGFRIVPYGFAEFSDSAKISDWMRRYYAELVYYYNPSEKEDFLFQATESPLERYYIDPTVKWMYNSQVHPNPFCVSLGASSVGCSQHSTNYTMTFRDFLFKGPHQTNIIDMEGRSYYTDVEEIMWIWRKDAQRVYTRPKGDQYQQYQDYFKQTVKNRLMPEFLRDDLFLKQFNRNVKFHKNNHWNYHVKVNSPQDLGVNVIGYLTGMFGVGKSSVMYARSFQKAGIPINAINMFVKDSRKQRHAHPGHGLHLTRSASQPVNICVVNADQTALLMQRISPKVWQSKYNIGIWAWELEVFPQKWMSYLKYYDEIWTVSSFTAESIKTSPDYNGTPVKVLNIPYSDDSLTNEAVDTARVTAAQSRELLKVYINEVLEGDFVFLIVYDCHSFMERKNPQAAIKAFMDAFPLTGSVSTRKLWLIVKTINSYTSPKYAKQINELKELSGNDPRVHFLEETLTNAEFDLLQRSVDCYVSLHHSEGFGMNIYEMLAIGKPVIATNYGGVVDIFSAMPAGDMKDSCVFPIAWKPVILEQSYGPYSQGQHWAEPDYDAAVASMIEVTKRGCQSSNKKWPEMIQSKFGQHSVGLQAKQYLQASYQAIVAKQNQFDQLWEE